MRARRLIVAALVLVFAISGVFATRIGITYNGNEYILNTSRSITNDNVAYFSGMYDGFASVAQGRQMYEIYDTIRAKTFPDLQDQAAAKAEYEEAFLDFMTNYSYGAEGNYEDIYQMYSNAINQPASYDSAEDILYYGSARFYFKNI